ncbi:monooxygenase [Sphaerisporangium krabiense]|uniref:Flavin reductase (DIM6/NTAB) family NADH-FMN oxidoreductase RutF n=1 Tax=Sphaerisporangium krabiense TaxID=763782 RepID=A0A7W8Z6W5_9ACTN|nr:flavin reductase family protein [Sphaerisporangium krabiense]MBB5628617.1 flavin reductase (DIM6/NTAB) family NADH-FMN oxidoreductase RutF [Sphaerisporangium krabiense]GII60547.1 monooxygenase [Sphaerisporangium krabiense]
MSTPAARLATPHGAVTAHGHPVREDTPAPPVPLPSIASDRHGPEAAQAVVDPRHFRNVLGRFATGVVAITAMDPATGEPAGIAVNSFTSVSLDPPLVAFCVAHTSSTWPRLRQAGRVCVNVLADHHEDVSRQLAAKGTDKFAGLAWTSSPGGHPLIDEALAWIDCSIEAEHPAGDHLIVVARVHDLGTHADRGPLLFFRGSYGRFDG